MKDLKIEAITLNTRIAAVQCSYSVLFMGEKLTSKTMKYFKTKSFLSEQDTVDDKTIEVNEKLFAYLVKGIIRNHETLDTEISKHLKIELSKNDSLIVSIIRAGTFELLFRENTPAPIIISEYTKIANKFYPEKKTALVNAILDKIAKSKVEAK
ncbi:MAG: transcription antitermination factor NusB [Alphaproteobacteria bacterium]|nr:transcription antitermination factor NusB [Alphaproteobacteria bacterium]